jgi:hypothetical protein
MEFTMSSGMAGPHEFDLHVLSNDPTEPDKVLVIKSDWVE